MTIDSSPFNQNDILLGRRTIFLLLTNSHRPVCIDCNKKVLLDTFTNIHAYKIYFTSYLRDDKIAPKNTLTEFVDITVANSEGKYCHSNYVFGMLFLNTIK